MRNLDNAVCVLPPADLTLIIDGPLSTFVIITGVIGNLYCLRVLLRTSINTIMLVSLAGLAVWDVVLLTVALGHHSLWATLHLFGLRDQPWDPFQVALNGLLESAHIASTWMLISVSAERFFAVSRPFLKYTPYHVKRRRQSYVRLVGGLIRTPLLMAVVACVLSLPCSFEFQLSPCVHHGRLFYHRTETWLLHNTLYVVYYRTLLLSFLKTFGPFFIIALLTLSTLKSMRASMHSRATILIEQGQDHLFMADRDKTRNLQTLSMLLLGKFLVLRCWPTAVAMVRVLTGSTHSAANPADAAEIFLLLNSATNSFVFVVLKSAFESRRLRRIRMRQRALVAKHAEQVLSIGKLLAVDRHMLIGDAKEKEYQECTEIIPILNLDSITGADNESLKQ